MIRTHKWSDLWGIPGGKIKGGETCEAALRREIMEETSLRLEDIRFVMIQDCIEPAEFETSAHFLLVNYVARTSEDTATVILNDEAEEFRWLTPEGAMGLPLNQPTRALINEATRLGFLSPARTRRDEIRLIGLDLPAHIGVPDEERALAQNLHADVILELMPGCEELKDDLARTIDYAAVAQRFRQLASATPRRLIETLAADIAECALREFGAICVTVEIRKRILPGVDHVAVRLTRSVWNSSANQEKLVVAANG